MRSNLWPDHCWSFINTRSTTSAPWAFGDMCSLVCNKTKLDEKKHVHIWRSYIHWRLEAAEQIDTIIKNILSSFSFLISKSAALIWLQILRLLTVLYMNFLRCVCVNSLTLVCRCPRMFRHYAVNVNKQQVVVHSGGGESSKWALHRLASVHLCPSANETIFICSCWDLKSRSGRTVCF